MSRALQNPYSVLGLDRSASPEEIKQAYRKLALTYHPDRNLDDPDAGERFKDITEAYALLRDPESRARYDRHGLDPRAATTQTVDWQTIFREAMNQRGDFPADFDPHGRPRTGNAVFDTFFGAVTGLFRSAGLLPGEHRQVTLEVPLAVAREGGVMRVQVGGPSVCATCRGSRSYHGTTCPSCRGQGVRASGNAVDVTVPSSVRDGTRLRLSGLGGPGNPPGDVFVTLGLTVPPDVSVVGNDVFVELPITPLEAQNGFRTELLGVPVDVPAGSSNGQKLRFAGAGLSGGSMVVTVRHDVWRGLLRAVRGWFGRTR